MPIHDVKGPSWSCLCEVDSTRRAGQSKGLLLEICNCFALIRKFSRHGALDGFEHASVGGVTEGVDLRVFTGRALRGGNQVFGDKLKENRSLRPFGLGLLDKTKDFAQEG